MAPTTCLKAPTPNKSFMMRQNIQTSSHYQILMESFLVSCETKGHHTVFAFFCRDLLRRSPRRPKKKVSRGKGACIELDGEEIQLKSLSSDSMLKGFMKKKHVLRWVGDECTLVAVYPQRCFQCCANAAYHHHCTFFFHLPRHACKTLHDWILVILEF